MIFVIFVISTWSCVFLLLIILIDHYNLQEKFEERRKELFVPECQLGKGGDQLVPQKLKRSALFRRKVFQAAED